MLGLVEGERRVVLERCIDADNDLVVGLVEGERCAVVESCLEVDDDLVVVRVLWTEDFVVDLRVVDDRLVEEDVFRAVLVLVATALRAGDLVGAAEVVRFFVVVCLFVVVCFPVVVRFFEFVVAVF